MGLLVDSVVVLSCVCIACSILYGMFGDVAGGNLTAFPIQSNWFAWHPVLMTCAFPCLMTLGRYSYVSEALTDKSVRRQWHLMLMVLGSVAGVFGYICIYKAHAPSKKFFGYDFVNGKWTDPIRVAHDWVGYIVLALVLLQVPMGFAKFEYLKAGNRVFIFHGVMGKLILALSASNVLIATYFWSWSILFKTCFAAFIIAATVFATVWPAFDASKREEAPLVEDRAQAQSS